MKLQPFPLCVSSLLCYQLSSKNSCWPLAFPFTSRDAPEGAEEVWTKGPRGSLWSVDAGLASSVTACFPHSDFQSGRGAHIWATAKGQRAAPSPGVECEELRAHTLSSWGPWNPTVCHGVDKGWGPILLRDRAELCSWIRLGWMKNTAFSPSYNFYTELWNLCADYMSMPTLISAGVSITHRLTAQIQGWKGTTSPAVSSQRFRRLN